jgi:hypothetical protein
MYVWWVFIVSFIYYRFFGVEADDEIFCIEIITAFEFILTVICCMDCSLWLEQVAVIFPLVRFVIYFIAR